MDVRAQLHSGSLSIYTCLLCVALLILYIHWLPPFMVLLAIFWYFEKKDDLSWTAARQNSGTYLYFLFIVFFLWQLSGLVFADSLVSGLERMFKRTAFVVFPTALFFPSEKIKANIRLILEVYVICIIVYIVYCLGNALANSFVTLDGKLVFRPYHEIYTWESWFTGFRFSGKVHPSYLAMYVLLAILISLELFLDRRISRKNRKLWLMVSVLLLPVILMLSSRAGIIAAAITLPLFLVSKLRTLYPGWMLVAVMIFFITVFVSLLAVNSRIRYTLDDISKEKISETLEQDIRLNIWRSAWGVIKENTVIGVGTGNASYELKREFIKRGYTEGLYEGLNAHNQFLEILLENGIIGLIIFLCILGFMAYIAISDRNQVLMIFVLLTIVFFFFETMLNRLAGIMFFPFFSFLLVINGKQKSAD